MVDWMPSAASSVCHGVHVSRFFREVLNGCTNECQHRPVTVVMGMKGYAGSQSPKLAFGRYEPGSSIVSQQDGAKLTLNCLNGLIAPISRARLTHITHDHRCLNRVSFTEDAPIR